MKETRRYRAYLLRLWQEGGTRRGDPLGVPLGGSPPGDPLGERPHWRASLERPQGGGRLGFASLADLFAFLEEETGSGSPGSRHPEQEGR
jgi:hypothetical protein